MHKKCNNFTVSENKKYLLNRVQQYEKFKETIQFIPGQDGTIEELDFEIEQAKNILDKIS